VGGGTGSGLCPVAVLNLRAVVCYRCSLSILVFITVVVVVVVVVIIIIIIII
jgi:hypothetical protein